MTNKLTAACATFIDTLSEGSVDHKTAVKQLAAAIADTADLQEACAAVMAIPSGASAARSVWLAALVRLVVLAERRSLGVTTGVTGDPGRP
jgi:hypothetical protein